MYQDIIQLDDLVYDYPDITDKELVNKITNKEEFINVKPLRIDRPTSGDTLYNRQKLFKRYMIQYDTALLNWDPGVGKTGAFFAVSEHYTDLTRKGIPHPYKKIYVVTPGKGIGDVLFNELTERISPDKYMTEKVMSVKSEKSKKSFLNAEVRKYYDFLTYGELAKRVNRAGSLDSIRERYSGSIFIFDEVHNVKVDKPDTKFRNIINSLTKILNGEEIEVRENYNKEEEITNSFIYIQLWKLCHVTERRKIILSTATPFINRVNEMGQIMNLILPVSPIEQQPLSERRVSVASSGQLPLDDEFYRDVSIEKLEPYLRGRISYMRRVNTNITVEEVGEPLSQYVIPKGSGKYTTIIYPSVMSKLQQEVYLDMLDRLKREEKKDSFLRKTSQISNFVYPNKQFSEKKGFNRYITERSGKYNVRKEFQKYLGNAKKFQSLSPKYYSILKLCNQEKGNCWVYSNLIRTGAVILGLGFQYLYGYSRYKPSKSAFRTTYDKHLNKIVKKEITLQPKLRYAYISQDSSDTELKYIIELFNSYENRNGDYLKVLIGTPKSGTGYSFSNVLQIHMMSSEWNKAKHIQARDRGIRTNSHQDLIKDGIKVVVKIYNHCSVLPAKDKIETADVKIYKKAEDKSREISRINRMMKRISFDCFLARDRNILPPSEDFQYVCDYRKCNYRCYSPSKYKPKYIDYSSYDVLYSKPIVNNIKDTILFILRTSETSIPLEELFRIVKSYNIRYEIRFVIIAVNELLQEHTSILNRFGYKSKLSLEGNTLFLQRDYAVGMNNYSTNYYSNNLIVHNQEQLDSYVDTLAIEHGKTKIEKIINRKNFTMEQLRTKLDVLPIENRAAILEKAISSIVKKKPLNAAKLITQRYTPWSYISLPEPLKYIKKSKEKKSKGPGRPSKRTIIPEVPLSPSDIKDIESSDNQQIHIHILSSKKVGQASHNVSASLQKVDMDSDMRILKPSESVWREPTPQEKAVYVPYLRQKISDKLEAYEKEGLFGTILGDKQFRIVDKEGQQEREAVSTKAGDKRVEKTGRKCGSIPVTSLAEIAKRLKLTVKAENPKTGSKKSSKPTIKDYCREIKKYLIANDKMIIV